MTVLGSVSTRLCASLVGTTWHLVPLFLSTRILGAGMLGGVIWYRFFLVVIALVLTL